MEVLPNEQFCNECGTALQAVPQMPPSIQPEAQPVVSDPFGADASDTTIPDTTISGDIAAPEPASRFESISTASASVDESPPMTPHVQTEPPLDITPMPESPAASPTAQV